MKSFFEWLADTTGPSIKPVVSSDLNFQQLSAEVHRCVSEATAYLESHPEEDRVEFRIYNTEIMVWRTKINTAVKLHLGWKSSWEKHYHETSVDDLVEFLYARRGS